MEKLKVEYMSTDALKPYANNAKIHTAEQIEQIKKSIQEFGMNDPIAIWKNNEIIEGHGRLIACGELGIDQVPVIRLDALTDEQRKAYTLVHNKLTMNTDFDIDLLNMELDDITDIDMSDFGFLDLGENEEGEKKKPEVQFTEVLGEENNYIVLKFTDDVDWLQIQTIFGLETVKAYSTRDDGKINQNMERCGVGRVVDGAEFLNKIGVNI